MLKKNRKRFFYITTTILAAVVTVVAYANGLNQTTATPQPSKNAPPSTNNLNKIRGISENSISTLAEETTKPAIPSVQKCQVIYWDSNHVYTISGSIDMATHILFPENSIDVIMGNKELWNEEHRLNHVFIKPNTTHVEGEETTMTFIGESNTSYEFLVKRVPAAQAKPCVIIKRSGNFLNNSAWNNYQNKDQKLISYLSTQFEQEKKEIVSQQQNALDKYRGNIYTNYCWSNNAGWFGKDFVSDVYDDGRWTYIRVKNDDKTVMAIYGEIDDKKNLLQFSYDEATKIYRVSGIYQKLILSYGKNTITIRRKS